MVTAIIIQHLFHQYFVFIKDIIIHLLITTTVLIFCINHIFINYLYLVILKFNTILILIILIIILNQCCYYLYNYKLNLQIIIINNIIYYYFIDNTKY